MDNVKVLTSSVSRTPGTYAAGSYAVFASASDTSGNTANCSFDFTVLTDTTPPNVTCPVSQVVSTGPTSNTAVASWPWPTIVDSFGLLSAVYIPSQYVSGATFQLGVTVVKFNVTDIFNNFKVCTFKITVIDTVKPIVTCPASFNVTMESGQSSTSVAWPAPTVYDNVKVSAFIVSNVSGVELAAGIYTISTFANDTSGNVALLCDWTVWVQASPATAASSLPMIAGGAGGGIFIIILVIR